MSIIYCQFLPPSKYKFHNDRDIRLFLFFLLIDLKCVQQG